jgi:diguanylate cyclase (GGDEF)-like protein/PAS domain S-box-containing protein
LEQITDHAVITDCQGRIEFANEAFERVTGYSRSDVVGGTMRILKSGKHDAEFYQRLWATILDGRVYQGEVINRRANGELFFAEVTITPLRDDEGRLAHFIATGRDVTEQRLRDPLTGLPTKALLLEHIEQALAYQRRDAEQRFALLFIDLDRFRVINETYGPAAGNEVLIEMSHRIQASVREVDTVATTTHIDRDEFAVLLGHLRDEMDARRVAERILDEIQHPVLVGDVEVVLTANVGIAFGHAKTKRASDMLGQAETAMNRAKDRSDERCHVYDERTHGRAVNRLRLESELRRAVLSDQIVIHYQPVLELETGTVVGGEALVRWRHPERGLVSPGEFIPIAEQSGLIIPLGVRILRDACRQARVWRDTMVHPLTVAVNVSTRQFLQPDFVNEVRLALGESGIDASLLEIEMTESTTADNPERVVDTLRQLKSLGIRLLLDDFGTGYSSLSYLTQFPLDVLKIDRSFVMRTPDSKHDAAVAQTIVAMAHALELEVVAEGVETAAQAEFLRSLGCQYVQGYLFSPPVPPERFEEFVNSGKRLE